MLRSAARRASEPEWSRRDPQLPQSIWWHTDAIFVGFRIVRPVDETPALTSLELRSRARRLSRQCGKLGLIIIDYLQLMSGSSSSGENRATEISEISRSLKVLARDLDVPILAMSQLSRAVEQRHDKRPILSDLRESGSIEQDADLVMFIYRDEYYDKESEREGIADLIISKHRNGGLGNVELTFQKEYPRFMSYVGEDRY